MLANKKQCFVEVPEVHKTANVSEPIGKCLLPTYLACAVEFRKGFCASAEVRSYVASKTTFLLRQCNFNAVTDTVLHVH